MNSVVVIGIKGHSETEKLKDHLEQALHQLGIGLPVKEVSDLEEIVESGVSALPALRINGKVLIQQIIPEVPDIAGLLKTVFVTNTKTVKMKKIIVPTDFSITSQDAYRYALELAPLLHASVKVVHVSMGSFRANDPALVFKAGMGREEAFQDQLRYFVQHPYSEEDGVMTLTKTMIEYEVIQGRPIPQLLELSKAEDTAMFVMGSTGSHGLAELLFGTVSTAVAQRADCPVLLVPTGATFSGFDKLLLASDYLAADPKILEQVMQLTTQFQASIHFVHVRNSTEQGNYQDTIDKVMDKFFADGSPPFSFYMTTINASSVRKGLNKYMEQKGIDLTIVVAPQRDFVSSLFQRSLTKEMALFARTPLLVYHTGFA